MENLNAEQVKKALEHCINRKDCSDCVIKNKEQGFGCLGRPRAFFKNALALINSQEQRIKELAEENERLNNRITCQVVIPDEKMEEIKIECLERVELDIKAIQADIVRKMHSKIKERCIEGGIYPAFVARIIDNVAEEITNGKIT